MLVAELSGEDERRGTWAQALLTEVARGDGRARVLAALEPIATSHAKLPARRRAIELLIDLEAPTGVPAATCKRVALARDLRAAGSPATVAAVGDRIATLLDEIDEEEVVELLADHAAHAAWVIDELLQRHDLETEFRSKLRSVRAGLGEPAMAAAQAHDGASLQLARSPIGRTVVVAKTRLRRNRWRAIAVLIDETAMLDEVIYRDDFSGHELERDLIAPLQAAGYLFETAEPAVIRTVVADAARSRLHVSETLPRGYYLGRDLLAITTEHLTLDASNPAGLLGRAVDLLAQDAPNEARPLLEQFVARYPDDADGAVNLGLCLLAIDDIAGARRQFSRAAWLAPRDPDHHWNLAVASLRENRAGACYLALVDFVAVAREEFDPDRIARARRIMGDYERLARTEHPDTLPTLLARTDDTIWRAQRLLETNQHRDAVSLLEGACLDMPIYAGLVVELALAQAAAGDISGAKRAIDRAASLGAPAAAIEKVHLLIATQAARLLRSRRDNADNRAPRP